MDVKNIAEIRISKSDMDRLESLVKQGNEFIGVVGTIGMLYGKIAEQQRELDELRCCAEYKDIDRRMAEELLEKSAEIVKLRRGLTKVSIISNPDNFGLPANSFTMGRIQEIHDVSLYTLEGSTP